MTQSPSLGVSRGRPLAVWLICCLLAGGIFLAYAFASLAAGRGEFIMPLDDVYIHFQYAKQLALGQPYVYNPGLPPSSGATSFLYPFILAVGYLIGFQGLNLGLWAMAVGAVALACSMWLVYRLVKGSQLPDWLAVLFVLSFALAGPVSWHFMSGMETGLVILFTLSTLCEFVLMRYRRFILSAALLALIRPEGSILAVIAAGLIFVRLWQDGRKGNSVRPIRPRFLLLIPIAAIIVQPLVNLFFTGSAVASGNSAKSVFGMVPFDWGEVVQRIAEQFYRIWSDLIIGERLPHVFLPIVILAVMGLVLVWSNKDGRLIGLLLVLWGLALAGSIATLDTAFWHFKRYQMPIFALFYPLAIWGGAWLFHSGKLSKRRPFLEFIGWSLVLLVGALVIRLSFGNYLYYYTLNALYVYQQPYQMARWLQANTPEDAVVAVHDTGLLRYMGGRTTIDMVGLTTPGAADYWRNGPGSVAEFLMNKRPDYIAAYGPGHGFGLSMVTDTSIYGKPLVEFKVQLDNNYNVALAADYQGIYKPEWDSIKQSVLLQPSVLQYLRQMSKASMADIVRIADLDNEILHEYTWKNQNQMVGFPTVIREMNYLDCAEKRCLTTDAGRRINGEEKYRALREVTSLNSVGDSDAILIIRVHPIDAGTIDIYAGDQTEQNKLVATRWIPSIPGHWLEIPILIPAEDVADNQPTYIRIVPHMVLGYYESYSHTFVLGKYEPITFLGQPLFTYQSGAMVLASADIHYQPGAEQLGVNFEWYTDGSAKGDYITFVHLYDDVNQPPVAQTDIRPGGGTLPPGNWLPGVLHDTIMVDLKNVPSGKYQVAIGFYDPATFERLAPDSGGDAVGRLFIGEVEIKAP